MVCLYAGGQCTSEWRFRCYFDQKGLKPIDELSKTSSTVTANCLDTRIPTESVPGELHELVDNFNEMLSRLDDSFLRLSGFSADIAH
ncbi:HAMP domain-containing protein, partial [Pseudomonas sp. SST3]